MFYTLRNFLGSWSYGLMKWEAALVLTFWNNRMMHVGRGHQYPLHVEYVHIDVTLSFIQGILSEALLSHPRLKLDRKIALVKALGKVIWIQNDLFAKWYARDGDEFEKEMEVPKIEKEEYLHGKKILHDESESGSESELMRRLLAVYEEWYTTVEVQVDQSDVSVTPASTPTLPTGLPLANSPSTPTMSISVCERDS